MEPLAACPRARASALVLRARWGPHLECTVDTEWGRVAIRTRTINAVDRRAGRRPRHSQPTYALRRTSAVPRSTARVVRSEFTPEAKLLRGQSDPFPSPASSSNTATPITYLPSSVSVRRLHSPSARASSALGASTSTTSSTDSGVSVPPLSTSPNSAASTPLTSPDFPSHAFDQVPLHASLSPAPHAYYDGSVGRKGGTNVRRGSGVSSVSASSTDGGLLPPISIAGEEYRYSPVLSPAPMSFPQPPPLRSPSLQAFPTHAPPAPGVRHSAAVPSFSAARVAKVALPAAPTAQPTRPPPTASNPANRWRHARTHSTTSNSSRSSAFSYDEQPAPSSPATWGNARSPVGSPTLPSGRAALAGVDWSAVVQLAELDFEHLAADEPGPVRRVSGESEEAPRSSASVDCRHEADEAEKEARVARKIADLEIRNTSLLAINASLERVKVKHTKEIRELRRRMRESVGGAGLAALRAQVSRLDEGDGGSDAGGLDSDGESADEGDDRPEPTWQELLEGDATFSALAATVESLITRGRRAIEYEPSKGETGRVLSTVEMEDRLEDGLEGEADEEDEQTPESSGRSTPATSIWSGGKGRPTDSGLGIAGWQGARR
ncbi:hypothetical protein JCM3770_004315 [Rhodotorula araucariae]